MEPKPTRSIQLLAGLVAIVANVSPSSAQPPGEVHARERSAFNVLAAIYVTEAFAFGSAAAARDETGARIVGVVEGISGVAVLSIAVFEDGARGWPEFLVPYGVGLLGLSYYNLNAAGSPRRGERFWTNAIGVNAVVAVGFLTNVALGSAEQKGSGVSIQVRPTDMLVSIRF